MFGLSNNVRYFMCQHPVNMRKGIDSLFNLIISELRETIANLESLLQERDKSLDKASNQMRGMSRLLEKTSEKQASVPAVPKTAEEVAQKEAERKARGNNGAKRKMRFEMETVVHDIYPKGMEGCVPFSTRCTVRYEMIPTVLLERFLLTCRKNAIFAIKLILL